MRKTRMLLAGTLLATMMTLGGCKNRLKDENTSMGSEVNNLRSQLADRTKALEDCNNDLRARDQQLAALRRETGAGGAAPAAAPGGNTGFEGIAGVNSSASAGEVTASVESDLLFDSGKTTLKTSAKKSLDQVASVLKSKYASQSIRVVGHTDTDPIVHSGFKSNYHLGFERAYEVRKYLIEKGVDAKHVSLASYGPDMPKGGKAQSRRVEVVVIMNK